MLIETARFGDFELNESKLIEFPSGIPGFEELKSFIILEINETKPLYWLQSTQNKHISLPVIIPFELLDDYYIEIRENELEGLHIKDKNDLLILNVVVVPEKLPEMTANLAAPIIVNLKDGLGKQLLIDAAELPIKYPIYDAIRKKLQGGASDVGAI
ncbi:MAG: Flagellar assembly factor FliW [Firmicutes bacterium ADurb.Bin356]|nr:MAG: Flagellar assembly factor FliW [Firmicutes bacterium ADurb.Bin356]HPY36424.1 flagellar assembly protein FliW [Clostridia bacterium]